MEQYFEGHFNQKYSEVGSGLVPIEWNIYLEKRKTEERKKEKTNTIPLTPDPGYIHAINIVPIQNRPATHSRQSSAHCPNVFPSSKS